MSTRKPRRRSCVVVKKVSRTFTKPSHAERYRRRLNAAIARLDHVDLDERASYSIHEKLNEFLEDCIAGIDRKPCSDDTAKLHRARLLMFDAAFHSQPIDAVSTSTLTNWIKRRLKIKHRGKCIQRSTVNNDLKSLRAFIAWAQGKGFAPADVPIKTIPLLSDTGLISGMNCKPPKILDIDQIIEVIDAIDRLRPDVALFLLCMLRFCQRPKAVARLRRRDLVMPTQARQGRVDFVGLKGGLPHTLHFGYGSAAHHWADRCVALHSLHGGGKDSPLLVCIKGRSKDNPGGFTTQTLDKAVQRVCAKLDLGFTFQPYYLRHSIISWLQDQEGITAATVQSAAGHSRVTTQEAYSHRKATQAKAAFDVIENYLTSKNDDDEGKRV